jgi:hypothetical protein
MSVATVGSGGEHRRGPSLTVSSGFVPDLAGRDSEAITQFELANQAMGDVPFSMAALGFARARVGHRAAAEQMLRDFQRARDAAPIT